MFLHLRPIPDDVTYGELTRTCSTVGNAIPFRGIPPHNDMSSLNRGRNHDCRVPWTRVTPSRAYFVFRWDTREAGGSFKSPVKPKERSLYRIDQDLCNLRGTWCRHLMFAGTSLACERLDRMELLDIYNSVSVSCRGIPHHKASCIEPRTSNSSRKAAYTCIQPSWKFGLRLSTRTIMLSYTSSTEFLSLLAGAGGEKQT
jgi:hypothetical protein